MKWGTGKTRVGNTSNYHDCLLGAARYDRLYEDATSVELQLDAADNKLIALEQAASLGEQGARTCTWNVCECLLATFKRPSYNQP